jgi:DNA-binding Lrp family transcriptional regulator
MFYRPEPWTSVFSGGFITPEAQRGNPLISSYRLSYNDMRLIDKSLQENPEILNAVNKMQNVGFRIEENYEKYQQIIATVRKAKIAECDRKISKYIEEIAALKLELAAQEAV